MNRINLAIEFAAFAHRNQVRKNTKTPYIAHPFAVAFILKQYAFSEDIIIAGLLHDVLEDTAFTIQDIRNRFGDYIGRLVVECSEPDKSNSWEDRKQHTIDSIDMLSNDARIILFADKLHNLQTIQADLEEVGPTLWTRFNRGYDQQKWYYKSLLKKLEEKETDLDHNPIYCNYARIVKSIFESSVHN
jgi:(p)ppGpp synthase/HD superfamily hydrolase